MDSSKIRLSESELQLFCDEEVILTKNRIIAKIIQLLQELEQMMLNDGNDAEAFSVSPKITRGENYLGLPYVILDYPRKSNGNAILFIRSMFWWGHFYSSTLHVSGKYKQQVQEKIFGSLPVLTDRHYYLGINEDPWLHHFETNNYALLTRTSVQEFTKTIHEKEHVKIAANWPLKTMDQAVNNLFESWRFLAGLVT